MARHAATLAARPDRPRSRQLLAAIVELLKPITWFPPMWAFACGLVSAGLTLPQQAGLALGGVILAGPLLCGASQAVNDWFDREVDAINEPTRPIPSGRIPGRWGLVLAVGATALALLVAAAFGRWVFVPALFGSALSWAYSAPPIRLKRNGWLGAASVALSYEGLAWLAGFAVVAGIAPHPRVVLVALLYSVGAHGIMTLNDFKAIDGDRRIGIRSLPVVLGVAKAAQIACAIMLCAQLCVLGALWTWDCPVAAIILAALIVAQTLLMPRLIADPKTEAARYNATGTSLFVLGMMVAAVALRSMGAAS